MNGNWLVGWLTVLTVPLSPRWTGIDLLGQSYHLVDLVVTVSASRAEDLGFESLLRWDFSGVESYQ